MCRRYCVEITCEMEVDILHGNDLCMTATRRASFDTKTGAETRLAEADRGFFTNFIERISKTHSRRRFALTGWGWCNACNKNQLGIWIVG